MRPLDTDEPRVQWHFGTKEVLWLLGIVFVAGSNMALLQQSAKATTKDIDRIDLQTSALENRVSADHDGMIGMRGDVDRIKSDVVDIKASQAETKQLLLSLLEEVKTASMREAAR